MTAEKIRGQEQGSKQDQLRKIVGNLGAPGAITKIGIIVGMDPVSTGIITGQVNIPDLHDRDIKAVNSGDVD